MKKQTKSNTLSRALNPLPSNLKQTLVTKGLWAAYLARPQYQRNDYIGWITRAKLETTRQKRTQQMFDELKQGDRYMKMKWNPR
ncbi:MAG: YdeI/OmpD-associated family protein [Cyclobacteriaceae bacterium]